MAHKAMQTRLAKLTGYFIGGFFLLAGPTQAEDKQATPAPIQDNSFLVEEAYNQERGIVQHINTFSRMWNSKDWTYTFTEEFPGLSNPRHQLSYTFTGMHAGAFAGSGAGVGDMALNYRYQVIGSGASRLAFAPRLTVLAPFGDETKGRGSGGTGIQANLPVSFVLHPRVVSHWNVGGTLTRNARDAAGNRANAAGYSLGQSFVFLAHPRFNALLETSMCRFQSVTGPGQVEWTRALYVSPGIRWAHNLPSGLQIVPGVAVPVGIGPGAGRGIFVYLSFEAPFGLMYKGKS